MAALIPFTSNYTDVSTYEGYQFEFHCQRCGNGYRSAFRHSVTGFGGRIAALGGGILGGEIGSRVQEVGLLAQWDRSSTRGSTNDKRLLEASEDVAGHFVQCRGCAEWVCRDVCWDDRAGCCTRCVPPPASEPTPGLGPSGFGPGPGYGPPPGYGQPQPGFGPPGYGPQSTGGSRRAGSRRATGRGTARRRRAGSRRGTARRGCRCGTPGRPSSPAVCCTNCGATTAGRFCAQCGSPLAPPACDGLRRPGPGHAVLPAVRHARPPQAESRVPRTASLRFDTASRASQHGESSVSTRRVARISTHGESRAFGHSESASRDGGVSRPGSVTLTSHVAAGRRRGVRGP